MRRERDRTSHSRTTRAETHSRWQLRTCRALHSPHVLLLRRLPCRLPKDPATVRACVSARSATHAHAAGELPPSTRRLSVRARSSSLLLLYLRAFLRRFRKSVGLRIIRDYPRCYEEKQLGLGRPSAGAAE